MGDIEGRADRGRNGGQLAWRFRWLSGAILSGVRARILREAVERAATRRGGGFGRFNDASVSAHNGAPMSGTPPPTRIVRFADLHLDTSFAWAGATSSVARQRRQGLRNALLRIVAIVREVQADALFCGGDLYEDQRVTPDTAEFLRATFAGLDPTPVFLAPGNHDWYGPESVYALTAWSPNVHVFREPRLVPVSLRPGVTLWDGAHCAPANTDNFLAGFGVRGAPDSANRAAARNRTPPSTPARSARRGCCMPSSVTTTGRRTPNGTPTPGIPTRWRSVRTVPGAR